MLSFFKSQEVVRNLKKVKNHLSVQKRVKRDTNLNGEVFELKRKLKCDRMGHAGGRVHSGEVEH